MKAWEEIKKQEVISRMKWIAVRGSQQVAKAKAAVVEADVRKAVGNILSSGNGILLGGFPGVNYLATREALKICPSAEKIGVIIPAPLVQYVEYFSGMVGAGAISDEHARSVILQLAELKQRNPRGLRLATDKVLTYSHYDHVIIQHASLLLAFIVTPRTVFGSIFYAHSMGIPVETKEYEV